MGDTPTQRAEVGSVEVLFTWRDAEGNRAVIDAELAEPERCPAVWIGTEGGLRFVLPSELVSALGDAKRFRLVGIEDGRFVLRVPPGARLVATRRGELVDCEMGSDGVGRVELSVEHVAEIVLGDFSFYVRPGPALERSVDRGPLLDWRAARWGALALAVHAFFVGSFFLVPPNASALNMDLDSSAVRYVRVQMAAIERAREEQRSSAAPGGTAGQDASAPDEAANGGDSSPNIHVAGGPGRRSGSARRSDTPAPTRETVAAVGTVAALARMMATVDGDGSPFGNPDAFNGPGGPGFALLAAGPGDGGFGGLRLRDAGHGTCVGTRCVEGTIAAGPLSTSGDVGPGGVGVGTETSGRRISRVPGGIRPESASTTGGLSREQVQRTVRRHINEVRFCYSQALQRRPDLEGRVAVHFLVRSDGVVQAASIASQSGELGDVGTCVAESVRRWTFPASEGPTSVTYPFVLQSTQ